MKKEIGFIGKVMYIEKWLGICNEEDTNETFRTL